MISDTTISVENLKTFFFTKAGVVKAVNDVSFSLKRGEIMGLVGESGSGKTVTGFSILRLIDRPGRIAGGRILFQGEDLASFSEEKMRTVRGSKISSVFQDPLMTLNPVLRIDTQMMETVLAHDKVSKEEARKRSLDALVKVGIPGAQARITSYPHQFSGGMRQRVSIAIALLGNPDLIIADEPTTALDVTIQAQILYETKKMCLETGTSMIWITHDLSVVAGLADTVSVMYAGKIVEQGSVDEVLDTPLHPYTRGLISSVPSRTPRGKDLYQIPGMTPSLLDIGEGCSFRERCPRAGSECEATPEVTEPVSGRKVRCFHPHTGEAL
ncbi:MAG: ABC transporter ATP-binding protein [Spirochaetia bacterium]|jgi:peptide/nickel transport system ATP-binding protein|nr:ABC transporter ATP-binding protein [Spirochaetia bacterium]